MLIIFQVINFFFFMVLALVLVNNNNPDIYKKFKHPIPVYIFKIQVINKFYINLYNKQ